MTSWIDSLTLEEWDKITSYMSSQESQAVKKFVREMLREAYEQGKQEGYQEAIEWIFRSLERFKSR